MVARLAAAIATPGSTRVQTMASVAATIARSQYKQQNLPTCDIHRRSSSFFRSARNLSRTRVAILALTHVSCNSNEGLEYSQDTEAKNERDCQFRL